MLLINRSFLPKIFELNAEFQRIVGRDKKAFLNEQCKVEWEIIEWETIEWERLKISSRKRDINGIFHARMGMIKDRNDKDLIEAEEIKKRCQDYTEELHKKVLWTRITTMVWSLT